MSEDRAQTGSTPKQATPEARRARPAQRKLLILALLLFAIGGGKIYLDRHEWLQAMQPPGDDDDWELPKITPISEGFKPIQVVPHSFEPITDATFVSAEKANETLDPTELVLGVVVGDEARAYPINMLTGPSREIINDTLGGRSIAATW